VPTTRNPPNDRKRFDEYAARYHDLFARADQREWFDRYVWGLLTAPSRKNVEAIAAASTRVKAGANLGQALQHFVTDSPWDHGRVIARYREILATHFRPEATAWVIHDGALLKKGRNSVGTQRQFARSVGRKVNCQLAVVVGTAGPSGYVPLTARLYLPGYWLREHPTLAARTVPGEHRRYTTKSDIAVALLDEVRAEGWTADEAVSDEGCRGAEGFEEALLKRCIRCRSDGRSVLALAEERFQWMKTRLGLDHFEGRTWVGWHHHLAMVLTAAGFLLSSEAGPGG
jgi:SRSO17 transposase